MHKLGIFLLITLFSYIFSLVHMHTLPYLILFISILILLNECLNSCFDKLILNFFFFNTQLIYYIIKMLFYFFFIDSIFFLKKYVFLVNKIYLSGESIFFIGQINKAFTNKNQINNKIKRLSILFLN